jgi:NAD(P)-dependent dehydrogenase (short-subunit alcohol dehydrogenase family)
MGRLDSKVTIITGAGSGIGRAGAILFAEEGAKVVVADVVIQNGEETVRIVKEAGGEAIFVKADVSKTEDIKKIIETAVSMYGKLDVIWNNAGIAIESTLTAECPEEEWDKTIAINLKGVFLGMKYAIPEMLRIGGGSIINTSSQSALGGMLGESAYSASKSGIIGLSRVSAVEYANQNIRVNCIAPGPIDTPIWAGRLSPESIKNLEERLPQCRIGKPKEVAQVALFLASRESSHVNGQTINVCGGLTAQSPIYDTS